MTAWQHECQHECGKTEVRNGCKTDRIQDNTQNSLTRNEVWEFNINRSRISLGLKRAFRISLAITFR